MITPRTRIRFSEVSRDICDPSYIAAVAAGEREPDPLAWPAFGGTVPQAKDFPDRARAYDLGHHQGFDCEMGGRLEKATPPVGMPRNLLSAFARGVIDGSELVKYARSAQKGTTDGDGDFDPWADLNVDLM